MVTMQAPDLIFDSPLRARHASGMAAVRPKSLRLASVATHRRGVSRNPAGVNRLKRLEAKVGRALVAVENEIDYRVAVSRWENHLRKKTKLLTGEEVWRELGLPD
jgi:hypothetical protein